MLLSGVPFLGGVQDPLQLPSATSVEEMGFNKSLKITERAGRESEMEMSLALLLRKPQQNRRSLGRSGPQAWPAWE